MPSDTLTAAVSSLPTMVDRLSQLVHCESPSNSAAHLEKCADLLEPWLSSALRRPSTITRVGENVHLVARAPSPRVLILGHFDTVWPVGTIDSWPFSVDSESGIATGPGTFDMKGGIIQALTAIELLTDTDHISVLLTSDEEIGSMSSRLLIEELAREAGAVLVCEPTADGGAVKVSRKGIANYAVRATGRAAHAGLEPQRGVNATIELAHQILRISAFGDPGCETSVVPTLVTAGTTSNTVPESAEVHVDARSWTIAELERVDSAMHGLTAHLSGATVAVSGGIERPPFEEPMARWLYAEAAAAATDLGLGELAAVRSGGGSDGNITAALGIPTLDGLGAVGGHPHARDEHVIVTAMPERAALLSLLLARLAVRSADH
ncbi:M20 family peptidase [Nocardia yunnanensis]|uniref:M20 family peptidase n=1 Tax=Nocardia yunnanensis TaxID=2382165 RepID=A0A386ZF97_9NOCA|nr:M20/M25/M40 family metallo-hydrolase [Nocardia yunnanensis]AYF75295.1 M20 family peptidase [Nocardia yunnanensis]